MVLCQEYFVVYGSFLLSKIKQALLYDNQVHGHFFEFLPTDNPQKILIKVFDYFFVYLL